MQAQSSGARTRQVTQWLGQAGLAPGEVQALLQERAQCSATWWLPQWHADPGVAQLPNLLEKNEKPGLSDPACRPQDLFADAARPPHMVLS